MGTALNGAGRIARLLIAFFPKRERGSAGLGYSELPMRRPSPTLAGFGVPFRRPEIGLAEIAWRWSFTLGLTASALFAVREYLSTLTVTAGESFLLRSGNALLVAKAMSQILRGSAPRVVGAMIALGLGLTAGWIVLASLGRAVVLSALFEHFRERESSSGAAEAGIAGGKWRLRSLAGLNFLRASAGAAALIGTAGALLAAGAYSSSDNPSPGAALLIFYLLTLIVGMAWSVLNWFLSTAAIFVVGYGRDTFGALADAVTFCRERLGGLTAVGTWFGLAHVVVFVFASSIAGFPLAFVPLLPAGAILGGVLLVTLLYFAAVDFLYVGRLGAYVCMLESRSQPSPGVDRPRVAAWRPDEDDILSDVPGLVPPPAPIS